MIIKNDFSNERDYRQDINKNKVYIKYLRTSQTQKRKMEKENNTKMIQLQKVKRLHKSRHKTQLLTQVEIAKYDTSHKIYP